MARNCSSFPEWLKANDEGTTTTATTLSQQVALASELYRTATSCSESTKAAEAAYLGDDDGIVQHLETCAVGSYDTLVSWQGISVDWFLDFFCSLPYVQMWETFQCPLWFIRKVCILELQRQMAGVQSGTLVDNIEQLSMPTSLSDDDDVHKVIVSTPTTFLSYTGRYKFGQFREMLALLRGHYVWMDIFCVDQFAWTAGRSRKKGTEDQDQTMKQFRQQLTQDLSDFISRLQHTTLLLDSWKDIMATLGQICVLWEIFDTVNSNSKLSTVLPESQPQDFIENCLEDAAEFEDILTSFASVDVANAKAMDKEDKEIILGRMRDRGIHMR